ncbi:MAG: ribosome silencing factor [Clostridia bacterium]|nr:ribosome silencing factor [Clostridia bacterium]
MTSKEKAIKIATVLSDKKGEDVKIMEIKDLSTLGDYFVIATGTSNTHIKALRDHVDEKLKEDGVMPMHNEGGNGSTWLLIDYGDVIVHIFDREAAEFYDLERLWLDAPEIDFE